MQQWHQQEYGSHEWDTSSQRPSESECLKISQKIWTAGVTVSHPVQADQETPIMSCWDIFSAKDKNPGFVEYRI